MFLILQTENDDTYFVIKKEKERKKCAVALSQGCCDPGMWQCRKKMNVVILPINTDISLF